MHLFQCRIHQIILIGLFKFIISVLAIRLPGLHAVQNYTSQVSALLCNVSSNILLLSDSLDPKIPPQSGGHKVRDFCTHSKTQWDRSFQTVSAKLKSAGFYPDKDLYNLFHPTFCFSLSRSIFVCFYETCVFLRFHHMSVAKHFITLDLICARCCRLQSKLNCVSYRDSPELAGGESAIHLYSTLPEKAIGHPVSALRYLQQQQQQKSP